MFVKNIIFGNSNLNNNLNYNLFKFYKSGLSGFCVICMNLVLFLVINLITYFNLKCIKDDFSSLKYNALFIFQISF